MAGPTGMISDLIPVFHTLKLENDKVLAFIPTCLASNTNSLPKLSELLCGSSYSTVPGSFSL